MKKVLKKWEAVFLDAGSRCWPYLPTRVWLYKQSFELKIQYAFNINKVDILTVYCENHTSQTIPYHENAEHMAYIYTCTVHDCCTSSRRTERQARLFWKPRTDERTRLRDLLLLKRDHTPCSDWSFIISRSKVRVSLQVCAKETRLFPQIHLWYLWSFIEVEHLMQRCGPGLWDLAKWVTRRSTSRGRLLASSGVKGTDFSLGQ